MAHTVITSIGEFNALPAFRIALGQKFTITLEGEDGVVATTNDPVLSVVESVDHLECEATKVGSCQIQIQEGDTIKTRIFVEVFNPAEATALNPVAGTPKGKKE